MSILGIDHPHPIHTTPSFFIQPCLHQQKHTHTHHSPTHPPAKTSGQTKFLQRAKGHPGTNQPVSQPTRGARASQTRLLGTHAAKQQEKKKKEKEKRGPSVDKPDNNKGNTENKKERRNRKSAERKDSCRHEQFRPPVSKKKTKTPALSDEALHACYATWQEMQKEAAKNQAQGV